MNFFIRNLFFLILSFSLANDLVSHKAFKISNISEKITEIVFEAPQLDIVNNGEGAKFDTNDMVGTTNEQGMPELPIYSSLFQMIPGVSYDIEYEVLSSHFIDNVDFKVNNYNGTSVYPIENISLSEPLIMRGLVLGQLSFIPYKYFSDDKKLEVYDAVQITITESGESEFDYFIPEKKSYVFEELYENFVINYERSDRDEDYQIPSILYICGGSSINNAYFQDLVEWRHKQGYIVTVVSTSETGTSENSINNYIINAYNNWDNPPEIVGLVGDVGGSYNIDCDSYGWGGYSGASDVIYSYVEGNDLLPEVLIGRISANGTSELYNIINKTIQYEKAQEQTDLGWFDRAALVGDPTSSGFSCAITNQYIQQLMETYGFDDVDIDIDGGGSQLDQFVIDQFNRGVMYYNYRGYYYAPGSYPPSNNQISNGYYTPFVTTITCGTGDFNSTSSSEGFVRLGSVNDPKGAVAAVGTSTTGTHTAYNNIVDMGIYAGLFSNSITHAGGAVASGRLSLFETYPSNPGDCVGAFSAWNNLIGDPALHLWTDAPKDFVVDYPNGMSLGSNYLDLVVFDSEGNTVENARVTLLMKDNGQQEDDNNTFIGEYYSNPGSGGSPDFGNFMMMREDNVINFDWGNGSPDGTIPNDDFQVRWTTTLDIETEGNYNFRSYTDDGLRLYIDNELVIDYWNDQGPTSRTGDIYLSEGSHQCIMEYYENGGGAVASLYWTPPGQAESLVLQNDSIENSDAIFITKLTDSDGRINFSWNEYQEGELYVTVTKRNYRPHEGSIQIDDIDGYAIVPDYESLSNYIDDSNGNNDGALNPGETINFHVPLSNFGSEPINNLTAVLSSSSDLVNIIDSQSIYNNIEVGQNSIGDGFSLELSSEAIFNDDINLVLNLSQSDNDWTFYLPISISSPKIDVTGYSIIEGLDEPGSTVTISISIQNNGDLPIENLSVEVISSTNKISVIDSDINFGNLEVGQNISSNTIEDNLILSYSESIFKGSVFPMEMKFSDSGGYSRSEYLNLTVGEVGRSDPLGPDLYGYYIYDSADINYNLAPVYDWIEIDPEYGGDGIDLDLYDPGNGTGNGNSTKFIDLPFTFNFYGEPYDQISISSNGWIALGRTNIESFRNYPIPGAGGPSPMIAAFWDDMKTYGGNVFYKTVEIDGRQSLVVEWSDMITYDNNSEEDFQVILYPNPNSETGDGDIKIQYKTFNNTSDGYYPEGGTPTHGCYATIGIENKYGNEGLQYTYNNEYPPAASILFNNKAILITTELPNFGILGDINSDDLLNVLDVVLLVNMVLNGDYNEAGDMNQDGILNVLDVVTLVNIVLSV